MLGRYIIMATAKKLDPKGFDELVQELAQHDTSHDNEFGPMVPLLIKFTEALSQLKDIKTKEELDECVENIRVLQEEVKVGFTSYCKQHGTTPEEAVQYLENPKNFSQKEWEELQAVRRRVDSKAVMSVPASETKHERKE
jgi:hypothetical protein